jgi:hypothetical protein
MSTSPNSIKTFWLVATDQVSIVLRRYAIADGGKCDHSGVGYCNAAVTVDTDHVENKSNHHVKRYPPSNPLWPRLCACGTAFSGRDAFGVATPKLYSAEDVPDLFFTLDDAPVGSMITAPWFSGSRGVRTGPDGLIVQVKTPGGWWLIDGPKYHDGLILPGGWHRTGQRDAFSVVPGVKLEKWSGSLIDGYLVAIEPQQSNKKAAPETESSDSENTAEVETALAAPKAKRKYTRKSVVAGILGTPTGKVAKPKPAAKPKASKPVKNTEEKIADCFSRSHKQVIIQKPSSEFELPKGMGRTPASPWGI